MTGRKTATRRTTKKTGLAKAEGDSPVEGTVGYELPEDTQVNLAQLAAEIEQATNATPGTVSLSTSSTPPDDDSPEITNLWVSPSGTSADAIFKAVDEHEPDPSWGVPQTMQDFPALVERLQADPEMSLSGDDLITVVKGLALNWGATQAAAKAAEQAPQ